MKQKTIDGKVASVLQPHELEDWSRFVETNQDALIYHTRAWGCALESAFSHVRGDYLVVRRQHDGQICGGMPLYVVKSWLLGTRLVSIPFAPIGNPLIGNPEDASLLLELALRIKREKRARSVEIRSRGEESVFDVEKIRPSSNYLHHYIPLVGDSKSLFNNLSRSAVQQEIKKAIKLGFSVSEVNDIEHWKEFYALITETRRRLSLPPIPFSFFNALRLKLGRNCVLLSAYRDGKVFGSLLLTEFGGTCLGEFIGDRRHESRASTSHLLWWHAIERALSRGHRVFSFGRTAKNNENLIRFKQRWGTLEEPLVTWSDRVGNDKSSRESSTLYRITRSAIKHMPDRVYQEFGKFLYRHLG